jgi:hypothetical protein
MFTGGYFTKAYFAGAYWAPTQGAIVQPQPETYAGSGGTPAAGRRAVKVRKFRLRKEDTRKLVLEALERARAEGRLVDLRDFYDSVDQGGKALWDEVKDKVASQVQEQIAPAFSSPTSPAFSEVITTADEIMAKAIETADAEIARLKREAKQKAHDDEEDIIEMLLLDGW